MRFFAFAGLAALALAAPLPQTPENSTAIRPSTVAVNSKFGWLIRSEAPESNTTIPVVQPTVAVNSKFGWLIKARDIANFIPVNSKWLIKKSDENSEDNSETTQTFTNPHVNGKWLIKKSEDEHYETAQTFTVPHVNSKWLIKKSENSNSNSETAQPFTPPHVNSKWLIKKSETSTPTESSETPAQPFTPPHVNSKWLIKKSANETEPETAATAAASNMHVSSKFGWLIRRVFWLPKREASARQLLRLPHSYPEEANAEDKSIAVPFKA